MAVASAYSLPPSIPSDYWDIDAILAEEERIPVKFLVTAERLGHLNITNPAPDRDIKVDAVVDLPFWMAQMLINRNFAAGSLPRFFNNKSTSDLLADPSVANLFEKNPFFYELGVRVAYLTKRFNIFSTLLSVFVARYQVILDKCQNNSNEDVSSYVSSLTMMERQLFYGGYRAKALYSKYQKEPAFTQLITASSMSATQRSAKRQRLR